MLGSSLPTRQMGQPCLDLAVILVLAFWPVGCTGSGAPATGRESAPAQTPAESQVTCVVGLFQIIWNGEPRYFLTDDQGQRARLLIGDDVMRSVGGVLDFNLKRVEAIGEPADTFPDALRVISIKLDNEVRQPCVR
jgi:hypothetical protein